MRDFNSVVITGRMTRDVELRTTGGGTNVADATLASNHKFGETDEVGFYDLVFWGAKAEFASKYLTKGKAILVQGRLQQQRWEKEGEKRSKVVIVVEDVTFLPGNKVDGEPSGEEGEVSKPKKSKKEGSGDGDIPF
jgi:single-strand DNA-binding protein